MTRYYMIVCGRVQGVGFRYLAQMIASELGLTGWVRNCDNGNVEIQVQGNDEKLLKFTSKINKGNGISRVEDICIKTIAPVENEKKFNINYY